MNVAILTMFGKLDTTYSLVNVVAEQLRMLLDAGITVRLLVCEQFEEDSRFGIYLDSRIEWAKVCNTLDGRQIEWQDYDDPHAQIPPAFFKEADAVADSLVKELAGIDICILHDILYQGWYLLHNVALRKAQVQLPHLRFLSFSHSAPLSRPADVKWPLSARFIPLPHTTYIALTHVGITPLARQYNVPEGRCRIVYNSLDPLSFVHNAVRKLAQQTDLFASDILMVYPGRLTPAKKFDKVAAFAGALKRVGSGSVKVVFCDFPSGDVDQKLYRDFVRQTGIQFGLDPDDLCFTSEHGFPTGFPRPAVLDLFTLSNVFVTPSYSELFPLIVLEAASRANLLVLNQAVPSLEEIGRNLHAVFMRWDALNNGFETTEHYQPSEQAYYGHFAEEVLALLQENPVLHAKTQVRQRYSPHWVWKNQLEPLLLGE
ncbi:glycosyltransferase [Ethanoligenens sp.]|uniref:glycosyltransferase n=1 Tax=Ethanoligenens sp. TaxID=2099655 RepID=UPI0039E8ACE8